MSTTNAFNVTSRAKRAALLKQKARAAYNAVLVEVTSRAKRAALLKLAVAKRFIEFSNFIVTSRAKRAALLKPDQAKHVMALQQRSPAARNARPY